MRHARRVCSRPAFDPPGTCGLGFPRRDNAEQEAPYLVPFQQSLSELGYIDGRTFNLLNTYASEQCERFNANAAFLAEIPVDVQVAVTRPAALAAQRATTTVPIVFILVPDPVGSKLVQSLARPGGNITGLTQESASIY
jgi:putative tryptophan/tyrosine transport system substrate-binding protein